MRMLPLMFTLSYCEAKLISRQDILTCTDIDIGLYKS